MTTKESETSLLHDWTLSPLLTKPAALDLAQWLIEAARHLSPLLRSAHKAVVWW